VGRERHRKLLRDSGDRRVGAFRRDQAEIMRRDQRISAIRAGDVADRVACPNDGRV
jgi:hypothetical protein